MPSRGRPDAAVGQVLEHFENELLDSAIPSELTAPPESPTAKRLREEDELKKTASSHSVATSKQMQASGVKQFIRPHSNGKDGTGYQFPKARIAPNRFTVESINATPLTFAPLGYPLQNRATHAQKTQSEEPVGEAGVRKADVKESIESNPMETLSHHSSVSAAEPSTLREHSPNVAPRSATPANPRDVVNISSDPPDDAVAAEETSENRLESLGHDDPGIVIKQTTPLDPTERAGTPVCEEAQPSIRLNGTRIVDDEKRDHPDDEPQSLPSSDGSAPSQSYRPKTAKHPAPVLSLNGERSVRVSKGSRRITAGGHMQSLPFVPKDEQTISDEDILMVLIHRRKQMEKNLSNAYAKVRTLAGRNDVLAQQNAELDDQLQQLSIDYDESIAKQGQLTDALDVFKAKYYKLKEFAKGIGVGMLELRQASTAQANGVAKIANEKRDNADAFEAAKAAFHRVEDQLNKHKHSLVEARHDQTRLAGLFAALEQQLAGKDQQLTEEKRRCRRLEKHITELSGTQQRQNKSLTDDFNDLKASLAKISRGVSDVDISITAVDICVGESASVIKGVQQQLKKGPQLSSGEATMLAALQPQIKEAHDSLIKAVEKVGNESQATSLSSMVESIAGIQTSVEKLTPTLQAFETLKLRNAKLESDFAIIKDERDRLWISAEKAQAVMGTSLTSLIEGSQQSSGTVSDKNAHGDLIRKWQSLSSNLQSVTKDLEVCQQQKTRLEQQLSTCQSEIRQQKSDHQRHQEALASQHTDNLVAQRQTFQAKFGKFENRMYQLKQANKENEEKAAKLSTETRQQEQALSDLRGKHDKASSEVKQLISQVTMLSKSLKASESQVETLQAKEVELNSLKRQAQADADEVQRLQQFEPTCTRLKGEVEAMKKLVAEQDSEAAIQNAALKQAEADARRLPDLQQSINELEQARGDLVKKLEQAEAVAGSLPQVRAQLVSAQQAKAEMDAELQRLRPLEGQLSSATEQKDVIAQELAQTKELLAQARQHVDTNTGLSIQLRTNEQRIAELEHQVSEAAQVQDNYATLQAETQQKDSLLTALQKKIDKSQQAAEKRYAEQETQDLRPIPLDESQIPEPLAQELVNSQDLPEGLPRRQLNNPFEVPPKRKVADRSEKNQTQRALSIQAKQEVAETQQLSQATSNIPESVPNTQPIRDDDLGGDGNDSDSSLSEIDETADWLHRGVAGGETRKAQRLHLRPPRQPQAEHLARPSSSSAMSEDLFSKHASGVGQASQQMHGHPISPPQRTVDPSDLVRHRETTPEPQRSRVQPNSAMKRRSEDDNQLLTGKKQKRTRDSGDDMPAPPSSAARSRSSIAGRSAPAPSNSQRRGRPARKSSRNEKYNTRFGSS